VGLLQADAGAVAGHSFQLFSLEFDRSSIHFCGGGSKGFSSTSNHSAFASLLRHFISIFLPFWLRHLPFAQAVDLITSVSLLFCIQTNFINLSQLWQRNSLEMIVYHAVQLPDYTDPRLFRSNYWQD
jgi:hypothetical protein